MHPSQSGPSFVLDHELARAVFALLDDDELPAEDRACFAELAQTTDPTAIPESLIDLLGLPSDTAAYVGRDLARRLGYARLGRCVDLLTRALARYGVTLDPGRVRALARRPAVVRRSSKPAARS